MIIIEDSEHNKKIYNDFQNTKIENQEGSFLKKIVKKPWGYEFVCCEMNNISLLVLHLKKDNLLHYIHILIKTHQ